MVEPNNEWEDGGDAEHHQTILLSRPLVSCIVDVVESVEGFLVEVFFPEWLSLVIYNYLQTLIQAGIAQLGEQQTEVLEVACSIHAPGISF